MRDTKQLRAVTFVATLLVCGSALGASEPPVSLSWSTSRQAETASFELLLAGNLEGDLAHVRCREQSDEPSSLFYATQAGAYWQRVAEARAGGGLEPLALNAGDAIFPGALARYLLTKGETGARELAEILVQIPWAGQSVGNHELAPPRKELLAFFQAAREAGLPLLAANVRCSASGGAGAICDAVGTAPGAKPYRLVERGPIKIGITAVIDPEIKDLVSRSRLDGLEILDPVKSLRELVPQMREAGADLIFVIVHFAARNSGEKAEELAGRVDGIDLMVTNGLFEALAPDPELELAPAEIQPAGYVVAPRTQTFVVGADTGGDRVVLAGLEARRRGDGRWQLSRVEPQIWPTGKVEPEAESRRMLEAAAREYCAEWGRPIKPGLELAQAFDLQDLRTFVLNVMRFETRSEVALANARSFRNQQQFPLTDTLTRADLYTALPFGDKVVTFELSGAALAELAKALDGPLVAAGLTYKGGTAQVNGRPINKARAYRIASNSFLAEGGDGILDPKKLKESKPWQPEGAEAPPAIAQLVDGFLDTRLESGEGGPKLSPDGHFPDLQDKFLWSYTGSVNATYNRLGVYSPTGPDGVAAYDKARLNVTASDQVNAEAKAAVRADSRNHGWDNDLLLLYATSRIDGGAGEPQFDETKDLIRGRSAYKFTGLRAISGSRWWAPVPYAELQAESEFTVPQEDRAWRLFEVRGILGTLFQVATPLELRFGANTRRSLLEPGGRTSFGLNVGYRLARFDLFKLLGKPVQLESELEYFFNGIGSEDIQELNTLSRLFFALSDRLFFTTSYSAFIYRTREVGKLAHSSEVTVGLNFLFDKTVQSF